MPLHHQIKSFWKNRPQVKWWWLVLIVVVSVGSSIFLTVRAVDNFQSGHQRTAQWQAYGALTIAKPLSLFTFQSLREIEVWRLGLELIATFPSTKQSFAVYSSNVVEPDPAQHLATERAKNQLLTALSKVTKLKSHQEKSRFLGDVKLMHVPAATTFADLETIAQQLLHEEHTYLILFQNSHELRATGGFVGSYAVVKLKNGVIEELEIQDIYQPDGQFTGYVEPPAGVREYLSSGKGLRLPDANWNPDFPSSAQTILNYFALGDQKNIDGVSTFNLSVAQKILKLTGDIYVPDYQVTVSAENLPEVARADRANFFPGSHQKPQFLTALFTQLKIKLSGLDDMEKLAVLSIFEQAMASGDIQLYSTHPETQSLFEKYNVAGTFSLTPSITDQRGVFSLGLIESNVGINKANKNISRDVKVNLDVSRNIITINFKNNNPPATGLISELTDQQQSRYEVGHYINYQRFFVDPEINLYSIQYQGQPVTNWDEEITTTKNGERLKQIGFLITLPAQQSSTLRVEFRHRPFLSEPMALYLVRQSGLPPTPVTATYQNNVLTAVMEHDLYLPF